MSCFHDQLNLLKKWWFVKVCTSFQVLQWMTVRWWQFLKLPQRLFTFTITENSQYLSLIYFKLTSLHQIVLKTFRNQQQLVPWAALGKFFSFVILNFEYHFLCFIDISLPWFFCIPFVRRISCFIWSDFSNYVIACPTLTLVLTCVPLELVYSNSYFVFVSSPVLRPAQELFLGYLLMLPLVSLDLCRFCVLVQLMKDLLDLLPFILL